MALLCRWFVYKLARIVIVALIGLIAIAVPGFGFFISFIGSFCCASLAFILPATCHLVLFTGKMPWWQTYMDYFLIMFGFTGMVFGVGHSIHDVLSQQEV
jgi:solute carrier family 36 (proton-coupled amino acid transporter)